jgi:hypothetical protein
LQDEADKAAKGAERVEARQGAAARAASLRAALRDMPVKPEFLPLMSVMSSATQAETETDSVAAA